MFFYMEVFKEVDVIVTPTTGYAVSLAPVVMFHFCLV